MTRSATDWVASLSPWPADGFGLERMHALLAELGDPQLAYPAVHVVGTNGKSTTTRMTEALLSDAGLSVGAYVSPHVRGWSERIRIDNAEADFERSLAGVRPRATALGATQFEALTAAALLAFAVAGVDVAVVEAGLGGRHDATNVLQSRVVVLTNVALDHMDVLGDTREAIAAEKLAVVRPGVTVVLAEPEWQALAEENGAAKVVLTAPSNLALAITAAEAFLGEDAFIEAGVDAGSAAGVALPGRRARRSERALAGVRPRATALEATQFEALTAAALLAFADAGVDVAVVEAGLGGRHDATNVLRSRVVVLTNVALDHMDVLGDTREAIAAEKLAVVRPGVSVVHAEPEWQTLAEENGAAKVVLTAPSNLALAIAAAEA
ncbi:MAG: Mur ligase family protein, partial [Gaiellaceae bacterium]